jgi:hypothetical protein
MRTSLNFLGLKAAFVVLAAVLVVLANLPVLSLGAAVVA